MSERKLKSTFKATPEGGQETEYAVLKPGPKAASEAAKAYNRKFRELAEAGTMTKPRLARLLREQQVWDDEKEVEAEGLRAEIMEREKVLARAKDPVTKQPMKLSEGRRLALELRKTRGKLQALVAQKYQLDGNTAESQAENERFSSLVATCMVYNETGKPVFKDLADYHEHSWEPHALAGANELSIMLGGGDADFIKKLPENKFLIDYGFVNDKLRLIDDKGRLISEDGKLIDEDGYYIDEDGRRVTKDGLHVDADGNYDLEDAGAFVNDDGTPARKKGEPEKKVENYPQEGI